MALLSNWRSRAICANDQHPDKWISLKNEDIEYAKSGCEKCNVKKECLFSAIENDSFIGVVAGISEFEYLMYTWEEVTDINESNWRRDDTTLSRLLQKAE